MADRKTDEHLREEAIIKEATKRVNARFVISDPWDPNNPEDVADLEPFRQSEIRTESDVVRKEWDKRDGRGFPDGLFEKLIADQKRDDERSRKEDEESGQTPERKTWIKEILKVVERSNKADEVRSYLEAQLRNQSVLAYHDHEYRYLASWREVLRICSEMHQIDKRLAVINPLASKVLDPLVELEKNLKQQVPLRQDVKAPAEGKSGNGSGVGVPAAVSQGGSSAPKASAHDKAVKERAKMEVKLQQEERGLVDTVEKAAKVLDAAITAVQPSLSRAAKWMQIDGAASSFAFGEEHKLIPLLKARSTGEAAKALVHWWYLASTNNTNSTVRAEDLSPSQWFQLTYMLDPYPNETAAQRVKRKEHEQRLAEEAAEKEEFEQYLKAHCTNAQATATKQSMNRDSTAQKLWDNAVQSAAIRRFAGTGALYGAANQTLKDATKTFSKIVLRHALLEDALKDMEQQLEKIAVITSTTELLLNINESVSKKLPDKKNELQKARDAMRVAVSNAAHVIDQIEALAQGKNENEVRSILLGAEKEMATADAAMHEANVANALEYCNSDTCKMFSIRLDFEIKRAPHMERQFREALQRLQMANARLASQAQVCHEKAKGVKMVPCPARNVRGYALCQNPDCEIPVTALENRTEVCKNCSLPFPMTIFKKQHDVALKDHIEFNDEIRKSWTNHKQRCAAK